MIVVLVNLCSCCVQNNLSAHPVLAVLKTAQRELLARSQPCQAYRHLSHRYGAHLALNLSRKTGLGLVGAVLQPEVQERDTGRGVAKRLDLNDLALQRDRIHIR